MNESVESLRRPKIEIHDLPIESIRPDELNPNELPDDLLEALKRDVAQRGFVQPVLVRPDSGFAPGHPKATWIIEDGEHRWLVLRELGAETVPSVIDDPSDADDARQRLITMNRLRGRPVPVKLAHLLVDLSKRVSEDELRSRLGMDEGEFRDTLQLAGFGDADEVSTKLRQQLEAERGAAPEVLQFIVSKRDAAAVERVLEPVVEETGDRGKALVKVCREYAR